MAYIPVSLSTHKTACFEPRQTFQFVESFPVAPVYYLELAELTPAYVLGFVKKQDSFQLVAVIGTPELGTAYTYPDGRWSSNYAPAAIRSYPFNMLKLADSDKRVLCIDENALKEGPNCIRLFDDAEQLTETVNSTFDFLQQIQTAEMKTDEAVAQLEAAGLITSWDLMLNIDEGKPHKTSGLYRIDEVALNTLDKEQYASLQGIAMSIVYAQLYSIKNSKMLDMRLRAKKERKDQAFDFNEYLNESDSDSLKF